MRPAGRNDRPQLHPSGRQRTRDRVRNRIPDAPHARALSTCAVDDQRSGSNNRPIFSSPTRPDTTYAICGGDAETIALPDRLDLIASASAVQWFDDLPRFARKAGNLLETEGYIVLSTFGPENFREIKAVTDEGLDYYTREQLQELFESAGFLTLETLEYTRSLAFDTPSTY